MASRLRNHTLFSAADPLERADDAYREFRDIVRIDTELAVSYRHSLGKISRFFVALAAGTLLASRCPRCDMVWLPPRAVCPNDLSITSWTELSGRGELVSWTESQLHRSASEQPAGLLAYLALDGAGTLFLHRLRGAEADSLRHGLPVEIVYGTGPVEHPLELCWFEPA